MDGEMEMMNGAVVVEVPYYWHADTLDGRDDAYKVKWTDEAGTVVCQQDVTIVGSGGRVMEALGFVANDLRLANMGLFKAEPAVQTLSQDGAEPEDVIYEVVFRKYKEVV